MASERRMALRKKATVSILEGLVERGTPAPFERFTEAIRALVTHGVLDAADSLVNWEWLVSHAREGADRVTAAREAGLTNDEISRLQEVAWGTMGKES
jgi:hypothetical protein